MTRNRDRDRDRDGILAATTDPARDGGSRYEAVVFDNDGVLSHPTSVSLRRDAVRRAFGAFDVAPAPDEITLLNDEPDPEAVVEMAEAYGIDPDAFWRRHEREKARAQAAAIRAGDKPAYDDIEVVRDLPVPAAVVSNNQHATVGHVVDAFGLEDAVVSHYGREPSLAGLGRRKPSPAYIERALSDLGTRAALYVGDSDVDIEAAAAAGIDSAFVERPHRAGYTPRTEPTYRISGLRALRSLLDPEDTGIRADHGARERARPNRSAGGGGGGGGGGE